MYDENKVYMKSVIDYSLRQELNIPIFEEMPKDNEKEHIEKLKKFIEHIANGEALAIQYMQDVSCGDEDKLKNFALFYTGNNEIEKSLTIAPAVALSNKFSKHDIDQLIVDHIKKAAGLVSKKRKKRKDSKKNGPKKQKRVKTTSERIPCDIAKLDSACSSCTFATATYVCETKTGSHSVKRVFVSCKNDPECEENCANCNKGWPDGKCHRFRCVFHGTKRKDFQGIRLDSFMLFNRKTIKIDKDKMSKLKSSKLLVFCKERKEAIDLAENKGRVHKTTLERLSDDDMDFEGDCIEYIV